MALSWFPTTSQATAGTLVGSGSTAYSEKSVTLTAAAGDLLIAGVGAADKGNGASTVNDIVTTGGTTGAWALGRSGGTSGSDANGIVGLAVVTTGGSITVALRMSSSGIGSSYHMGGGVYLIPAAEWNPSGTKAVATTFFADADGKVNLTPPAGSFVFFFGWDWAASSIASNAGTPGSGNLRVRNVDAGAYSTFIADWSGQSAAARDYGLLSVSGQDWAGGVVWVEAASGGLSTTATATGVGGVSATGVVTKLTTAGPTGVGAVTATGVVTEGTTAAVGGTAGVAATGVVTELTTAAVGGVGAVSASGSVTSGLSGTASATGVGAVAASGQIITAVAADVGGVGAVAASGRVDTLTSASVGGVGAVSATGVVTVAGLSTTASVAGVAGVSATGQVSLFGSASVGGVAGIMGYAGTLPVAGGADMTNQDLERTYLLGISTVPTENFISTPDLRDVVYVDKQTSGTAAVGLSAADAEIAALRAASADPNKDKMSLADLRRAAWGG